MLNKVFDRNLPVSRTTTLTREYAYTDTHRGLSWKKISKMPSDHPQATEQITIPIWKMLKRSWYNLLEQAQPWTKQWYNLLWELTCVGVAFFRWLSPPLWKVNGVSVRTPRDPVFVTWENFNMLTYRVFQRVAKETLVYIYFLWLLIGLGIAE